MVRILFILLFSYSAFGQISDFAKVDFKTADKIAKAQRGASLEELPQLVHKLTADLDTEVEQFRALYYWICHNIRNDYNLLLKNERKLKKYANDSVLLNDWKTTFQKELFLKLRSKKRTICTGYAYLLKEMAELAGFECELINGYGQTKTIRFEDLTSPNHSWNAIKLNGKWYLCDPTWSSGLIDSSTYEFHFIFKEEYFLMAPNEFAEAHRPLDSKWTLLKGTNN